jgi:hypothetical protein
MKTKLTIEQRIKQLEIIRDLEIIIGVIGIALTIGWCLLTW